MVFYVLAALMYGFILVVSIRSPLHYLEPKEMAVGTIVAAVIFAVFCFAWHKGYDSLKKKGKIHSLSIIYWITLGLFGFFTFILLALHGNHYHIVGDYEFLYVSALEQADGEPLSYPVYFLTYSNNIRPMLMLGALFKVFHAIHMDEYYPMLIISVITLLGSAWAAGDLLSDGEKHKWRMPVLLLIMACLPIFVFTGVFYTDTLSFGTGVIAVALLKRAFRDKKKIWLIPIAALIATIGAGWKITALIPVIAFMLVAVTYTEWQQWGKILLFGLCFGALFLGLCGWTNSFEISKEAKEKANPTVAWIAMGMTGDGSYAQGVDFSDAVNALPDKMSKSEFAKTYMKEHVKDAFSLSHLTAKTANNYAAGMFSVSDYTAQDSVGSILWEFMDPGGKHFYRSCQYMFCYIAMMYLIGFVGAVMAVIRLVRRKEIPPVKMVADLAFMGLFIFLMIWESNNRQLYNMLPMMAVGTYMNIVLLFDAARTNEKGGHKMSGKKSNKRKK